MLSLILKALMRALLIFFPVAYLSFGRSANVIPVGTGVIVLIVFVIALILISWARSVALSRKKETETMTRIETMGRQHR